eukprot:Hpha_TRINITY_DN9585_c0_g1::TRINITY_DN9585_c0_g1_i1::g.114750::m.114750
MASFAAAPPPPRRVSPLRSGSPIQRPAILNYHRPPLVQQAFLQQPPVQAPPAQQLTPIPAPHPVAAVAAAPPSPDEFHFQPTEVTLNRTPRGDVGLVLSGTILEQVLPETPAAFAGLEHFCGRIITHVNNERVSTLQDVYTQAARDPIEVRLRFAPLRAGHLQQPVGGPLHQLQPLPSSPQHESAPVFDSPATAPQLDLGPVPGPIPGPLASAALPQSSYHNYQQTPPPPSSSAATVTAATVNDLGLGPDEVEVQLGEHNSLGCKLDDMVLTAVAPNTPAAESELINFVGRVVTHANGRPVNAIHEVTTAVQSSRRGGRAGWVRLRFKPLQSVGSPLSRGTQPGTHRSVSGGGEQSSYNVSVPTATTVPSRRIIQTSGVPYSVA